MNAKKPRVLVWGMTNMLAGLEKVVASISEVLGDDYAFDYLVYEELTNWQRLMSKDNRQFVIPCKSKHPIAYHRQIRRFFAEHSAEYSAVWANISAANNIDVLKLAIEYEIPIRIVHAHNTSCDGSFHRKILHFVNRSQPASLSTVRWACSKEAGEFLFGDKAFDVIPNAVDFTSFAFSESRRAALRAYIGIDEATLVVGTVGRLADQKNQSFLIELLPQLLEAQKETLLVIVGEGELKEQLERQSKEKKVSERVFFAGAQDEISDWLSLFDVFVLPSKYEGLPVSLIEAQANGLPCIVADGVSREAMITRGFESVSLHKKEEWVNQILCSKRSDVALLPDKAWRFNLRNLRNCILESCLGGTRDGIRS